MNLVLSDILYELWYYFDKVSLNVYGYNVRMMSI